MDVETPHGTARVRLQAAPGARLAVVLGHGAGGSIDAPDLTAVAAAAIDAGVTVARVEQPYRVAGRRSAAPAHQLDTAWTTVLAALRQGPLDDHAIVTGGRSSGARVACRTAAATGATGVLCLAFPLVTPRGVSRIDELDAVDVPVLVVQGERDRFGVPPAAPGREVVVVRGDHRLAADLDRVTAAVLGWLPAAAG